MQVDPRRSVRRLLEIFFWSVTLFFGMLLVELFMHPVIFVIVSCGSLDLLSRFVAFVLL